MPSTPSHAPEPISIAIENLWRLSAPSEEYICASREFRVLEDNCRSVYLNLDGSRLVQLPSVEVRPSVLTRALRNFFCWNGAPWFEGQAPSAEKTSANLHRAFLRQSVQRTYLVPLDCLCLEDCSFGDRREVTDVRFGANEIVRLQRGELVRRVPVQAFERFGAKYRFPTRELDGFYWLVTSRTEPAGTIYQRTGLSLLGTNLSEIGAVGLFHSTYPKPVENALFILLLIFLKDPGETPWQPFWVPWIFSFTDDLFSAPVSPPDASTLSRSIVGDPDHYSEVPDQSEIFTFGHRQQEALESRWNNLESVLTTTDTAHPNFHPLTKHFFVKAISEYGVDEIISNLSCLEATLQLKHDRSRKVLKRRYTNLVGNNETCEWLDSAYRLRDSYLHSLGNPKEKVTWNNLAQTRWAITMAVDKYLDFASKRPDLSRSALLRLLES